MSNHSHKTALRERRKARIRNKVNGTSERPRLSVFRSAMHIYAQVIDDVAGHTLVSIHSFGKKAKGERANADKCKELGKQLAEKCLAKNVTKVVFDKNGFAYHGRLKAVADGAREAGLDF